MSKQDLERLDDLGTEAWNNHQPETFANLFADEFVARDLMVPEPIRTREGAAAYMQSLLTAYPDLHVRLTNRVIGEDAVAGEVEFTGTNTGPMTMGGMVIPPTNKSVVGPIAYFIRVKDGRVVEYSSYPDTVGTMIQLGLMPQP